MFGDEGGMAAVYGSASTWKAIRSGLYTWRGYNSSSCKREGTKASHFSFHNRTKNVQVA